ncbi:MAG: hypothetical protein A2583_08990 [Bdellovibrionales bacterium RIFOXYD1_FULL_53_11]|nr:MAG: hypothetical protein A2583_08990 [Bdellovibrionales bacterium RIFOXYD1_FULL_53_11]
MIKLPVRPFIKIEWLKTLLFIVCLAWAVMASVWAYRNRPEIILVGLDEAGTRIITSANDPILSKERVKFVREFLRGYYNYTAADYSVTISQTGALMSDLLWKSMEPEFLKTTERMKTSPITQDGDLLDLREVGEQEFEADLGLRIKSRLTERKVKYRAVIKIGPRKRSAENPYPMEVTEIHETEVE